MDNREIINNKLDKLKGQISLLKSTASRMSLQDVNQLADKMNDLISDIESFVNRGMQNFDKNPFIK